MLCSVACRNCTRCWRSATCVVSMCVSVTKMLVLCIHMCFSACTQNLKLHVRKIDHIFQYNGSSYKDIEASVSYLLPITVTHTHTHMDTKYHTRHEHAYVHAHTKSQPHTHTTLTYNQLAHLLHCLLRACSIRRLLL